MGVPPPSGMAGARQLNLGFEPPLIQIGYFRFGSVADSDCDLLEGPLRPNSVRR